MQKCQKCKANITKNLNIMIVEEMLEVASLTTKQTMNDIVNLTIVELALSHKAMQRLIAICELVRESSFNYKLWLKWYKQETNTERVFNTLTQEGFI